MVTLCDLIEEQVADQTFGAFWSSSQLVLVLLVLVVLQVRVVERSHAYSAGLSSCSSTRVLPDCGLIHSFG